jgi:hypothetical protein
MARQQSLAGASVQEQIRAAADTLMSQNRDNTRWSRREDPPCTLITPLNGQ